VNWILKLVPPQYRLIAGLAVLAAIVLGTAGVTAWGTWKVATWHLTDEWQDKVTALETNVRDLKQDVTDREASIKDLKDAVDRQNEAVDALLDATAETDRLQKEALAKVQAQAQASTKRVAELQRMLANGATPDDVLKAYWEDSQ
jgi:predicted RNase H-like nuclease (RuvC/YqgF family)